MFTKSITTLCFAVTLSLLTASNGFQAAEKKVPTVLSPFNGKSLDGWTFKEPKERSKWTVGKASIDAKKPRALLVEPATTGTAELNDLARSWDK